MVLTPPQYPGYTDFLALAAAAAGNQDPDMQARASRVAPLTRISSQVATACAADPPYRAEILSHALKHRADLKVALDAADLILAWAQANLLPDLDTPSISAPVRRRTRSL